MTVDTPFPERPGTPFWDPRGGASGMGDYSYPDGTPCDPSWVSVVAMPPCQDNTVRILNAITAGTIAAEHALNPITGAYCPAGMIFNPQIGGCQPGVSVTASAGGNGMMLLLIAGAVLFFMSRGR